MSSKKKTTTTQTNTLDPKYGALVYDNAQKGTDLAASYQPYAGPLTAGFNDTQTGAQQGLLNFASGNVGQGLFDQASAAASGVAGYQPMQISAGQLSGTDLSPYMNPYTQNVVDTSLADINRQREMALSQAKGQALKAGAWGGSGGGILQGQLSDNYDRAAASAAANLRSQGFSQAQDAARYDIGTRLAADQANQGAGQNAAALRLQASGVLSGLSDQQRAQVLQNLGVQSAVGDARQQQEQLGYATDYQRYVDELNQRLALQQGANQGVSIVPQTGTINGTQVTKSSPGIGGVLGALGSVAAGVATGGASLGLTGGLSGILGATSGAGASGIGLLDTFSRLGARPFNS